MATQALKIEFEFTHAEHRPPLGPVSCYRASTNQLIAEEAGGHWRVGADYGEDGTVWGPWEADRDVAGSRFIWIMRKARGPRAAAVIREHGGQVAGRMGA